MPDDATEIHTAVSNAALHMFQYHVTHIHRSRLGVYIRLLNRKWHTTYVYNQSIGYMKYGPPIQRAG